MTTLSIASRFINQALSNAVLNYDVITCITGNEDVKSGQSFDVLGIKDDTLSIMFGDKQIGVCHSTMAWRNGGSIAYFKPKVILESIDTLTIDDVGLIVIGKRYSNGCANDVYIEDASVSINDIDMKVCFEGRALSAGENSYHHFQVSVTNIIGVHPLLEIKPEVARTILDAIMLKYRKTVTELNPALREQLLAHIYATKPKYRLDQYDIAELIPALKANAELAHLSEKKLKSDCQIVINHYEDYMPAFINSQK